MIARPHGRPPRPPLALLSGPGKGSPFSPALLDDWTARWVAQLAVPNAERLGGGMHQHCTLPSFGRRRQGEDRAVKAGL
ncbi:hypothetical protein [Streptomyces sp. NPDC002666]